MATESVFQGRPDRTYLESRQAAMEREHVRLSGTIRYALGLSNDRNNVFSSRLDNKGVPIPTVLHWMADDSGFRDYFSYRGIVDTRLLEIEVGKTEDGQSSFSIRHGDEPPVTDLEAVRPIRSAFYKIFPRGHLQQ